jgi:hypothetical protein
MLAAALEDALKELLDAAGVKPARERQAEAGTNGRASMTRG